VFQMPVRRSLNPIPIPMPMKSLPILLASLLPVIALAQENTPASPVAKAPDPQRLPRVEFTGADLPSIIEFLQAKNREMGGDVKALNVIVSPGLEKRSVPSLSLRNVTPTEVLSIACRVLQLEMEPVKDEKGTGVVAWIVKEGAGGAWGGVAGDPFADAPGGGSMGAAPSVFGTDGGASSRVFGPAEAAVAGASGAPFPGGGLASSGAMPPSVTPPVVELASGGGGMMAAPGPQARVFGIAPLIASTQSNPDEREKERVSKFARLVDSLKAIARDHGQDTQVNAYDEMDIIVVKSRDARAIQLVAEAIEAMKTNASAAVSANEARAGAREQALHAEMAALRAQIEMLQRESEQRARQLEKEMEARKRAAEEAVRAATEAQKPAAR